MLSPYAPLNHLHITLVISALHCLGGDGERRGCSYLHHMWQALCSTQNLTGVLCFTCPPQISPQTFKNRWKFSPLILLGVGASYLFALPF